MYKRKDGLWEDTVSVPGLKRPKHFYGKTQAEVKRKIAEWRAENERGISVEKALDEWMSEREHLVSYKTLEGYRAPIKRIVGAFGNEMLESLTPSQIQAFVNSIAAAGYKRTTVQRPLDVLRMCYDYHITKPGSGIKYNPCHSVRMPAGLKQEHRELITEEQRRAVKSGLECDFGLFAYLIMFSGLRDGEALALTDRDISDTSIRVTKSVSWRTNKPVIKVPKTENGIREVPLLKPLRDALPKNFSGYLFSADGGSTPLTQIQFRRRWDMYCRQAGLATSEVVEHKTTGKNGTRTYSKTVWTNSICPYQLRHEFATICFDAEIDPKDVAEWMGHADEDMARRTYTHIRESRRVKQSQKLENFVISSY